MNFLGSQKDDSLKSRVEGALKEVLRKDKVKHTTDLKIKTLKQKMVSNLSGSPLST